MQEEVQLSNPSESSPYLSFFPSLTPALIYLLLSHGLEP